MRTSMLEPTLDAQHGPARGFNQTGQCCPAECHIHLQSNLDENAHVGSTHAYACICTEICCLFSNTRYTCWGHLHSYICMYWWMHVTHMHIHQKQHATYLATCGFITINSFPRTTHKHTATTQKSRAQLGLKNRCRNWRMLWYLGKIWYFPNVNEGYVGSR